MTSSNDTGIQKYLAPRDFAAQEISLGAKACQAIKSVYFVNTKWIDCYRDIASAFSFLKARVKVYHPTLDKFELLRLISSMDTIDLMDYLDDHLQGKQRATK